MKVKREGYEYEYDSRRACESKVPMRKEVEEYDIDIDIALRVVIVIKVGKKNQR